MEPTINSFSGRIVGSNNAQIVEQFNVMLRTSGLSFQSLGVVHLLKEMVVGIITESFSVPVHLPFAMLFAPENGDALGFRFEQKDLSKGHVLQCFGIPHDFELRSHFDFETLSDENLVRVVIVNLDDSPPLFAVADNGVDVKELNLLDESDSVQHTEVPFLLLSQGRLCYILLFAETYGERLFIYTR